MPDDRLDEEPHLLRTPVPLLLNAPLADCLDLYDWRAVLCLLPAELYADAAYPPLLLKYLLFLDTWDRYALELR